MNNTFNIKRFGILLRRQWLDFGKIYLLSLVVLAGVLIGIYILNIPKLGDINFSWDNYNHVKLKFRIPILSILGFVFVSIMASNYFAGLDQKSRAIMELMIPASAFEKTLAGIIYTTIISMAGFLGIFYFIDKAFVLYLNNLWQYQGVLNPNTNIMTKVNFSTIIGDVMTDDNFKYLLSIPLLITSIFLLGSIYFNRFHYIKTAVSLVVFVGLIVYTVINVNERISSNMIHINDSDNKDLTEFVIIFYTSIFLTLFFWLVTYIRLKEKEV